MAQVKVKTTRYPTMSATTADGFKLKVLAGEFTDSEVIVLHGNPGCGMTTFFKMMTGYAKYDTIECSPSELPVLGHSYKPQDIRCHTMYPITVREYIREFTSGIYFSYQFVLDVVFPLEVKQLMHRSLASLSDAELQRLELCICLAGCADIYLLDEPTAHLDAEQRILVTDVIKRFVRQNRKTVFVAEHHLPTAALLADRVIVFEGTPSVACVANPPVNLNESPLAVYNH